MKDLTAVKTEQMQNAKRGAVRELTQVGIDRSLPPALRVQRFVADVCDPYHVTVNGTQVRIGFTGRQSINTQLISAMSAVEKQSEQGNRQPALSL